MKVRTKEETENCEAIHEAQDYTKWEVLDNFGNVFNRLVMYRGDNFHQSMDYFGKDLEDGRLFQVFFLTQKDNMRQYFAEELINPELDIEKYVQEFKENKVVVIRDFLREEQAEIMYNWFNNDMPADWWEASSFPGIKEKKSHLLETSLKIKKRF